MILITGGTGYLGRELLRRLPECDIRVLARNEGKLIELKEQFPHIELITGDIADRCVVKRALEGVDKVYHLAAFKHVGWAEKQPLECIRTNVFGTINLLEEFNGHTMVSISTDKAAQVSGVYGATKMLMERLIGDYKDKARHVIVRYGNVLYSTGSVLVKWRKLLREGKPIELTYYNATRFFWTVDEAIDHIFLAEREAVSGVPYIPKMKAMQVGKLLEAMIQKYGRDGKSSYKEIGLQVGENVHETLDGLTYSSSVDQYTHDEIMERI